MGDGQLMEHFGGISVMNAREESYMDTDHGRMGGALDSMSKFEDSLTIHYACAAWFWAAAAAKNRFTMEQ